MNAKQFALIGASVLISILHGRVLAEEIRDPYVRIAELEIDHAQLESFKAAIKEAIEVAVRVESGCLGLYAVAEKDNPAHIRVFEIYRDENAYKTHVQTAHFRKFRATTDGMVKSRKLIDAVPITLAQRR